MRILPRDLSDWQRNDGREATAPFTVFLDGAPNQYWTEPAGHNSGALRNCGALKGNEFVALPLGLLEDGAILEACKNMTFTEYPLPECQPTKEHILQRGQQFNLQTPSSVCLLRGRYLD